MLLNFTVIKRDISYLVSLKVLKISKFAKQSKWHQHNAIHLFGKFSFETLCISMRMGYINSHGISISTSFSKLDLHDFRDTRLISNYSESLCNTIDARCDTTFCYDIASCKNGTVIEIQCKNYSIFNSISMSIVQLLFQLHEASLRLFQNAEH